ncbi:MAG: PhzF family phenazine biosynthesis protein [Phycisphaerales bacterium]|nr:MAG: PhzF family phenazine biosynthesis protein [Phycisphaerales bacterium]
MKRQIFVVDAFTSSVFSGNPAAVVPLEQWLPDKTMQAIGAENNLSETAFFVPMPESDETDFHLRWFTPTVEVELCGHATLAAAHVLVQRFAWTADRVRFLTKSGTVQVCRRDDRLELDFPARPGEPAEVSPELTAALAAAPREARLARDLMAIFPTEDQVRALRPDIPGIMAVEANAVIATAPGSAPDIDFVSRFFAPRIGIPEDPVTGSAHCTLIPYWAERLGKDELHALQVSPRGGELFCRYDKGKGRVRIGGRAVTYLEGTIQFP